MVSPAPSENKQESLSIKEFQLTYDKQNTLKVYKVWNEQMFEEIKSKLFCKLNTVQVEIWSI